MRLKTILGPQQLVNSEVGEKVNNKLERHTGRLAYKADFIYKEARENFHRLIEEMTKTRSYFAPH